MHLNEKIKGCGVALVTPFKSDYSVDYQSLERIVEYNIQGGVDFLVALGTTAETPTLSEGEKQEIVDTIIRVNASRLPVVVGIGGNDTYKVRQAIERVDHRVDAVLSASPYYNKPNQQGIFLHYKALAETGKPLILYNVPGRTGMNVEPATTLRLAHAFSTIFAIKEASGNFGQYTAIIKDKPADFAVLSGDDDLALTALLAGGNGVISVMAQALPTLYAQMMNLGRKSQVQQAYELYYKSLKITNLIYKEGNPVGIKSVLHHLGYCTPTVRLPLAKASEGLSVALKACLKELGEL